MGALQKMFWDELAEMLHIEEMLSKALLRMNAAAKGAAVKECLEHYRIDSQAQAQRLKQIFRSFELPSREKKSDGMMGVLTKVQQTIQRTGPGPLLDAALIAACRKITGFTSASYSSLLSWAKLVMTEEEEALAELKLLLRTECDATHRFDRLTSRCDLEAASDQRPRPAHAQEIGRGCGSSDATDWTNDGRESSRYCRIRRS